MIYRWEAPLFFANAGAFRRQVRHLVRERTPSWVVVQCEAITDVDVTAAGMLQAARRGAQRRRRAHGASSSCAAGSRSSCSATGCSRRSTATTSIPSVETAARRHSRGGDMTRATESLSQSAAGWLRSAALVGTAALVAVRRRERCSGNGNDIVIGLVGVGVAVPAAGGSSRNACRAGRSAQSAWLVGLVVIAVAVARALDGADRVAFRIGIVLRAARRHDGVRPGGDGARAPPPRSHEARAGWPAASGRPVVQPVVRRRQGRAVRAAPTLAAELGVETVMLEPRSRPRAARPRRRDARCRLPRHGRWRRLAGPCRLRSPWSTASPSCV